MHVDIVEPDKNKLAPLYKDGGAPGLTKDLLPLYDMLLHSFRFNNDVIRGGLVNLFFNSYEVFHNGVEEARSQEINVMDFIYEELHYAMMERKCPPYAPYIMKLLIHEVTDQRDLTEFFDIHNYGNLPIKMDHVFPEEQAGFGAHHYGILLSPRRW
jgi:hypothetical protein